MGFNSAFKELILETSQCGKIQVLQVLTAFKTAAWKWLIFKSIESV